ncbi:MAG TPA: PEP-CTERM sorting domain-containing protein [Candidatus Angelobacter sp.]|jgi:hypothetical protein|nr:PEP-CTERM sorting domain-containing protein [Candidatus Angelobacter sp.]
MKNVRWFLVLMLLGLSSSAALADSVDPAIGVLGSGDQTLWPGSETFHITTVNFASPSFFINEGTITNFLVTFTTEQGPFTALAGSAFPTVTTIVPGFEALMSGGTIFPLSACDGCGDGTQIGNQIFGSFFFELRGLTLGSNGTDVTFTSNVPEPGTMILLLSGLGAMGLLRLRRNKAPN